eukprot:COSAG06_NODE_17643_length_928_cov_1.740651_1_plen_228_part_01
MFFNERLHMQGQETITVCLSVDQSCDREPLSLDLSSSSVRPLIVSRRISLIRMCRGVVPSPRTRDCGETSAAAGSAMSTPHQHGGGEIRNTRTHTCRHKTARGCRHRLLTLLWSVACGGLGGWCDAESIVLAWSSSGYGGSIPQATKAALEAAPGIGMLEASFYAFASVTTDGQVLAWGDSNFGGSIPQATKAALEAAPGIGMLEASRGAFAAVTTDGQVLAWGDSNF